MLSQTTHRARRIGAVQQNSARWIEVFRSAFEYENEGLALLASTIPDTDFNRAWANFEF